MARSALFLAAAAVAFLALQGFLHGASASASAAGEDAEESNRNAQRSDFTACFSSSFKRCLGERQCVQGKSRGEINKLRANSHHEVEIYGFELSEEQRQEDSAAPILGRDTAWDVYTDALLGRGTRDGSAVTPCQEKCFHASHLRCTEEVHEKYAGKGTLHTFQKAGRWPIYRVGVVEEPASALFCLGSALLAAVLLVRYQRALGGLREEKSAGGRSLADPYGFVVFYKVYYYIWILTLLCAALFHTKDTVLTERMDYFSAMLALLYTVFVSTIRIFWIQEPAKRFAVFLPFSLYAAYHIWYMSFVNFDYGYNMMVLIVFGIGHGILVAAWTAGVSVYYRRYIWYGMIASVVMIGFEIIDFPPLLGYADAHSIWHLCQNLVAIPWNAWVIADAERFLPQRMVLRSRGGSHGRAPLAKLE